MPYQRFLTPVMLTLTDHEKGDSEVFPPTGLHGTEHRPHHGTADPHEGDHHDEPADGDCLGGCQATARLGLGLILYQGLDLEPSILRKDLGPGTREFTNP